LTNSQHNHYKFQYFNPEIGLFLILSQILHWNLFSLKKSSSYTEKLLYIANDFIILLKINEVCP